MLKKDQSLNMLGKFDLITCNFVLLEQKYIDMIKLLKTLQPILKETGILIITNCSSNAYKKANQWYSFNNNFSENKQYEINKKLMFKEDQPINVEVYSQCGQTSFTFFDFFHSGKAYREAYLIIYLPLGHSHS